MPQSIYLDNNSTTPILPEVVDAITECLGGNYLNASSQHGSGRRARRLLESARDQMMGLLGGSLDSPHRDQLVFTSGGTESNNLAIRGLVRQPGEVLVSAVEHPSALAAIDTLKEAGYVVRVIPVTSGGHIRVDVLRDWVSTDTRLVCVMLGNNEVGTLQPIEEISALCHPLGVPVHCDCVQAIGKIPFTFTQLGVTSMSFSAHKFHGPQGIGGLLVRGKTPISPVLVGGSQQLGIRPGTEPISLAIGMAKAMEIATLSLPTNLPLVRRLRDDLERRLVERTGATINGCEPRLPHTTNLSFPGIDRQALVMALDMAGIECSTGSACTSGSSEPSHVLLAMNLQSSVNSSIRLSLSPLTTPAEIEAAVERIASVVRVLGGHK